MSLIVQLANFYGPESGGLRTVLDQLGRCYLEAGHERVLVVPGEADCDEWTSSGRRIQLASPKLPGGGGYRMLLARERIETLLRKIQPDRLEVSDKFTLAWTGRWAADREVPAVLFSHERLDAILRVRVPRPLPLRSTADAWNRRLLRSFGRVVCTSAFSAEEFVRIDGTDVWRVPLGVDLNLFRPRPARPADQVRLVCVGRLSREKNPELAIQTVRALRSVGVDVVLTIVGSGPMRPDLEIMARRLPVTFTGHVHDRDALATMVASADIALAPCPVDTFGLAVLEALATGTPVVVPNAGGPMELIDASCGRAVVPTADQFAIAVMELLQLSERARRRAARRAAERYPWTATAAAMLNVHGLRERALT